MSLYALENISISCPYCGEKFSSTADTSIEQQTYIEDCQVCCAPIIVSITTTDKEVLVNVKTENE